MIRAEHKGNLTKKSNLNGFYNFLHRHPDLEKVVNRPQAENSEFYNVLKIARFATKDEQKYVSNVGVA